MQFGATWAALIDGLKTSTQPDMTVFPGDPHEDFVKKGSVWVSDVKIGNEPRALGSFGFNNKETPVFEITFSAYREAGKLSGGQVGAFLAALDATEKAATNFQKWLQTNPTLGGKVNAASLGQVRPDPFPTESGWCFDLVATVNVQIYPSSSAGL